MNPNSDFRNLPFGPKSLRATSESGLKARAIPWVIAALAALLVSACDESPEPGTLPGSPAPTPTDADLALGNQIAGAVASSSQLAFAGPAATTADSMQTGAGLSELGGNAVANQQAFRERFGL
jgi:hypothetical protein